MELLGVVVHPQKIEGPSTRITFVGIEIDVEEEVLRLPEAKCLEIRELMAKFKGRRTVTYSQFMSLVGKLSFAARCLKSARAFLQRMWDRVCDVPVGLRTKKRIKLTKPFWKDFVWWEEALQHFMEVQHGVSFWTADAEDLRFDKPIDTDASGHGLGAVSGSDSLQFLWNPKQRKNSSNWKELKTVVVAAEM